MARAIGEVLQHPPGDIPAGTVEVRAVEDVDEIDNYDAVVLGSAVYMGRWLKSARRFARENENALTGLSLWLFSSGPVGEPLAPAQEASDVTALAESLGARGTRTFAGRLRNAELGFGERSAVRLVHAAEADYREWDEIRSWAADIARTLGAMQPVTR